MMAALCRIVLDLERDEHDDDVLQANRRALDYQDATRDPRSLREKSGKSAPGPAKRCRAKPQEFWSFWSYFQVHVSLFVPPLPSPPNSKTPDSTESSVMESLSPS